MENQPISDTNNILPQDPIVSGGGSPARFNKKAVLIIAGGVLVLLILAVFVLSQRTTSSLTSNPTPSDGAPASNFQATQNSTQKTYSPAVQKAMNEAEQTATEFDGQQEDVKQDYPWIRKMPLNGDKYFIFFDLDTNRFEGKLYPAAGDSIDQIKADALKQLREKGVAIEKFQFDWSTVQQ